MCCHSAENLDMSGAYKSTSIIRPYDSSRVLKPREVISHNTVIPTASLLFLTDAAKRLPEWYYDCPVGDAPLHLFMLLCGEVYYDDSPMSVYRTGRPGSWTVSMDEKSGTTEKWEKYYEDMVKLYQAFNGESGDRYTDEVAEALGRIRFFTDLNEGRDGEILKKENAKFLSELPEREAFLLKMKARTPGLYELVRKTYKKFTK